MSAGVVQEIEIAFSETVLPSGAVLMNNHCWECIDTSRFFWNEPQSFATWQEAARRPGSCVEAALLTPDAWRYYLPALMIWCVRDTERVDVLVHNLVYELTPQVGGGSEFFEARAIGFSSEQRRSIATFLRWYRDRERAEWASIGADPPDKAATALDYWAAAG